MPNIGPAELPFVVLLFVLLAFLIARFAARKGYSVGWFFLLALLTLPAALVVVLILPARKDQRPANGRTIDTTRPRG